MKFLKRNQVIIFVVALMLVAAGYLNYTAQNQDIEASANQVGSIGDAKLVSSDAIVSKDEINNIIVDKKEAEASAKENEGEEKEENSITTSANQNDDYFANSKLGRDTMYSQMIETYQKVLENTSVSEAQKSISSQEIKNINDIKNAIMITENLIKTKGIQDVVIFVNDKSVNVIVKAEKIETEQIAQIQNIVSREMKAQIDNIHISNK